MTRQVVIAGVGALMPAGDGPLPERAVALDEALAALPPAMRTRAARAERVTQLALVAASRALADAALTPSDAEPTPDVGIVLGTAFGCFLTNAAFQERFAAEGMPGASPRLFAATVSNAAAGELAIACRLGGPLLTVSAGGASGLVALGEAAALVRHGRATAVVAGGMDAMGAPLERLLAEQGWMVACEAGAMVVCEDGERALARGVRARGTIVGWGGGFEVCPRDASAGDGLHAAVSCALELAGATPADVALVVSGTPAPLAHVETRGLAGIAARRGSKPPATLAAAGPLAVLVALAETPPGALALIVDVCESGHVAALVVRSMDT